MGLNSLGDLGKSKLRPGFLCVLTPHMVDSPRVLFSPGLGKPFQGFSLLELTWDSWTCVRLLFHPRESWAVLPQDSIWGDRTSFSGHTCVFLWIV